MSSLDNAHPSSAGYHVHPAHHEAIIKHAVRNIPGAKKLVQEWLEKRDGFHPKRLPDQRQDWDDSMKDFS